MEAKSLAEYKDRLEKERLLLLTEIRQNEKPADFGKDTGDPDEGIDAAEEVENQLAVAQDLKNRLAEIDVALSKIHSGKYGLCEGCHGPIEREILDVDPESRLCKHCKAGR